MTSLSIITPAYNEEEIIIASVKQTFESCKHLFDEIEYIVVNDGSSDNTQNLIEENFKNNPLFKLVRKTNGGFGSAISEGISHCTKEYIICVPADSPLDSEVLKRIYPAIEQQKEDLIITYRRKRKGYSLFMLFNSFLYHKVVSIQIQSKGIFMLAELIIKARNNGFSIKEIEVEQKQRVTGIATMTRPNAILKTFKEMLRFRLNIKNE
jgi:glycosyltransferase involved in cell wall biosynthesis